MSDPSLLRETHLWLARHGETQYNREGIMQGRGIDAVLNATGHAQARALARRLADVPLQALYASSLRRARQTAAYVAQRHPALSVETDADLDEMSWGVYEGRPSDSASVQAVYERLYASWDQGEFDAGLEGGESIRDVERRGLRALRRIVARHEGGTVCIVAHGRFLRVVLASLLEDYGLERMDDIPHSNASLHHLVVQGDRFRAEAINDTEHLAEETLAAIE